MRTWVGTMWITCLYFGASNVLKWTSCFESRACYRHLTAFLRLEHSAPPRHMENSGTKSINSLPTSPSVATILGVKGPLRFSPHGSTQKPHIILRRVTVPEDSNGDGQVNHVVRFSFFAQKRIEVRPGKEILLTVAGDDGQFENQCVVFEGDSLGSPAILEDSKDTQAAVKEESSVPITGGGAIPPKMRRAWTKKNSDGNHALREST